MSETTDSKKKIQKILDPKKQILNILENLENKNREKEKHFSNFLYFRPDSPREFDYKNGIKIFGIKGPEESVYEVLFYFFLIYLLFFLS